MVHDFVNIQIQKPIVLKNMLSPALSPQNKANEETLQKLETIHDMKSSYLLSTLNQSTAQNAVKKDDESPVQQFELSKNLKVDFSFMKSIAKISEGDLTNELTSVRNSVTLNEHSARNENKRSPRRTAFSKLSKTKEVPEAVVST